MLRTTKLSFFAILITATIATLFSFANAEFNQRQFPVLEEGDKPVSITHRTRRANGQSLEATVTVTKGSNSTTFQTTNGEAIVPSFGPGIHQVQVSKVGFVTINSSFDAQGTTMTLEYTLHEE